VDTTEQLLVAQEQTKRSLLQYFSSTGSPVQRPTASHSGTLEDYEAHRSSLRIFSQLKRTAQRRDKTLKCLVVSKRERRPVEERYQLRRILRNREQPDQSFDKVS
jgi:hypothetical protein